MNTTLLGKKIDNTKWWAVFHKCIIMKKFLTLTLLLLISSTMLSAQTQKGHFALGLHNFNPSGYSGLEHSNTFGFAFNKRKYHAQDQDSSTFSTAKWVSFSLNGSAHYFILNNFSVGLNLFFSASDTKDANGQYKHTYVLAGPEFRYYFNVNSKLKYWISADCAFGSFRDEANSSILSYFNTTYVNRFAGETGFAWFVTPHISLDAGIGYSRNRSKLEEFYQNDLYVNKRFEKHFQFILGFTGYL